MPPLYLLPRLLVIGINSDAITSPLGSAIECNRLPREKPALPPRELNLLVDWRCNCGPFFLGRRSPLSGLPIIKYSSVVWLPRRPLGRFCHSSDFLSRLCTINFTSEIDCRWTIAPIIPIDAPCHLLPSVRLLPG